MEYLLKIMEGTHKPAWYCISKNTYLRSFTWTYLNNGCLLKEEENLFIYELCED